MNFFGDIWVTLAYTLTLGAVVLCVVYGALNWNKPNEDVEKEIREEAKWEQKDPELNEGGVK